MCVQRTDRLRLISPDGLTKHMYMAYSGCWFWFGIRMKYEVIRRKEAAAGFLLIVGWPTVSCHWLRNYQFIDAGLCSNWSGPCTSVVYLPLTNHLERPCFAVGCDDFIGSLSEPHQVQHLLSKLISTNPKEVPHSPPHHPLLIKMDFCHWSDYRLSVHLNQAQLLF